MASSLRSLAKKAVPSAASYFVPRNPRQHLPVYTDFRSNGAQCFILIKNIQGHTAALANDLSASLFEPGDPAAVRMRVEQHSNRLVIKGARPDWKDRVVDWLRARGF
ncbi:ribosomal protein L49/IMG2 [Mycena maculata]|uniref:Large ribosomal subunit protein mL49 n=1 Tax=Mycena maculata TaxID=230809 RepID=A0AAD7J512_9AGAR|nr:ribosomal protein L49/IMG2 [Mycena maculata]